MALPTCQARDASGNARERPTPSRSGTHRRWQRVPFGYTASSGTLSASATVRLRLRVAVAGVQDRVHRDESDRSRGVGVEAEHPGRVAVVVAAAQPRLLLTGLAKTADATSPAMAAPSGSRDRIRCVVQEAWPGRRSATRTVGLVLEVRKVAYRSVILRNARISAVCPRRMSTANVGLCQAMAAVCSTRSAAVRAQIRRRHGRLDA